LFALYYTYTQVHECGPRSSAAIYIQKGFIYLASLCVLVIRY